MSPQITDNNITRQLQSITRHDPQGLAGIRTTCEIAAMCGITKDQARYRLERLTKAGHIECLGVIREPGQPVAWKAAS